MTIDEAKHYISYCIKEGVSWDEENLLTMSDSEIIQFAEEQANRGDAAYDALKEQNI